MGIFRVQSLFSAVKKLPTLANSSTCEFSSTTVASKFERVGFIGLGNMGSRMAKNLVKAGYNLVVHDVNNETLKSFSEMGVQTQETPLQVAELCDVVITMLPATSHVEEVYTGKNGLISEGQYLRPKLLIDSSTIHPTASRRLSSFVSNCVLLGQKDSVANPEMLDAPVSGGILAAENGTLTFMVGGSENAYLCAKSLLLSMGKNTIYCGGTGNGSAAKVCNNLAMAVSMLGISEALALGQELGISARTLTNVFNSSSARCWSSDAYNPVPGLMEQVPSSTNYSGGFATKLMAKDLHIAQESGDGVDVKSPMIALSKSIYSELCEMGHESEDFSCVFRHYYCGKDEK